MKQAYRTLPLLLLTAAIQHANAATGDGSVVDDSATMIQGTGSITINVRANDKKNYIGNFPAISQHSSTSTAYGSVVLNSDDTLTYTPREDFVGTDTFYYEAMDDVGYGGSATVTVTVLEAGTVVQQAGRNKVVGDMLDNACALDGESALSSGCSLLSDISQANREKALAEIAPDEALIQQQLLAHNARNNMANIYRTLALLRSGSGGTSVTFNDVTLPTGGSAGDNFGSPWTLLSSVQVDDLERDATLNEAGYDSKGVSLMLGLGYRISDSLNAGAALDWTNYDVNYDNKGGSMDADTYSLTGFVSWYQGPLSLDVQMGYTAGQSDAQRRFTIPVSAYADSNYDSSQLNFSTRVEWAWQSGGLALRPFLRLDYFASEIDSYDETGTSVWLMHAGEQEHEQTSASVGLDTSYVFSYSWGVLTPSLKMSLVSQDNISNDPVTFHLIEAGSTAGKFQLKTDSLDTQFYQWEINSVMVLKNGLSTFIAVQTLSDYDYVSNTRISVGLNKEF